MTAECLAMILYRVAQHAVCLLGAELGIKHKGGDVCEERKGASQTPKKQEKAGDKCEAFPSSR